MHPAFKHARRIRYPVAEGLGFASLVVAVSDLMPHTANGVHLQGPSSSNHINAHLLVSVTNRITQRAFRTAPTSTTATLEEIFPNFSHTTQNSIAQWSWLRSKT
ncbi:hypothetical protein SARC_07794 [Sphaeroforma arctica JP610]|uniref:Uncharacterized protein n=1 Tax=Sphaeroforma arctica JP610 TaxID=667725 RepID=A0A0L0FT21_9EUKA|nr:hypothetical protein SARC_07794 [Sphaeroforma arctica JP610]KNC79834.1 hypothetical protein SARC_07794 [Sphaeroforma arctica JP610]|eukprot:XP_014153736.1 hypothetical protein SARC_07794 [Sphaeroforma arctica JP610]